MTRPLAAAALALSLLLAGCAVPMQLDPAGAADRVLGEALQAAYRPAAEQRAALARAEQAQAAEDNALNRLRLAAMLSTLLPPLRDEPRAAALIEPLADREAPGAGRIAALLSAQLVERLRLARELERLQRERERERERDRAELLRERAERERERTERDKREEQLRQQLEALRSIERGILEREERLRRRQR